MGGYMIKGILILVIFGISGCASQTKESALNGDEAKSQKRSYFETKAVLEKAGRDDFTQKILKGIEDSISIDRSGNRGPETSNIVIPADSSTWVIYPYEDRFGNKHNLTEVNMLIRGAEWYSDHGASMNKAGYDNGSVSDFAPYYHVKGKSK